MLYCADRRCARRRSPSNSRSLAKYNSPASIFSLLLGGIRHSSRIVMASGAKQSRAQEYSAHRDCFVGPAGLLAMIFSEDRMSRKELKTDSVAEAYLALLADRGVEYLFANAGTDFAPIVEAYAKAAHTGLPAPKPMRASHENVAISIAHGYAAASGRVPAVMVHVSVGTANALCGVMNAARANEIGRASCRERV